MAEMKGERRLTATIIVCTEAVYLLQYNSVKQADSLSQITDDINCITACT